MPETAMMKHYAGKKRSKPKKTAMSGYKSPGKKRVKKVKSKAHRY